MADDRWREESWRRRDEGSDRYRGASDFNRRRYGRGFGEGGYGYEGRDYGRFGDVDYGPDYGRRYGYDRPYGSMDWYGSDFERDRAGSPGYGGAYGGAGLGFGGRDWESAYGRGYGREGYAGRRDWMDRAGDEVSSWFGDDEAARRREMDRRRGGHYGRGPSGYRRSDDRIAEDVNDRLTDDWRLDASSISVNVENGEVTLNGAVNSREDKRRAEDLADDVSGVRNVQNNLRVETSGQMEDRPTRSGTTSTH